MTKRPISRIEITPEQIVLGLAMHRTNVDAEIVPADRVHSDPERLQARYGAEWGLAACAAVEARLSAYRRFRSSGLDTPLLVEGALLTAVARTPLIMGEDRRWRFETAVFLRLAAEANEAELKGILHWHDGGNEENATAGLSDGRAANDA